MCPSYMVTREEKHSTRGRAHLLFEMIHGGAVKDGFASEAVKDALDLCLSCKGCLSDCPVNVDMASYKAEFLAHYYAHRLRPRSAYAFGLIMYWARLLSPVAPLVNLATRLPGAAQLARLAAGIAPRRQIPRFASVPFRSMVRRRPTSFGERTGEIYLLPDTFTNFFHPHIALAAHEVLTQAGFTVRVPQRFFCCGRPLYDYGMLDTAKAFLRRTMEALRSPLESGATIVVLEPSCASVFRHEAVQMFPDDPLAWRLSRQTQSLAQVLDERARDWTPRALGRKALAQPHCHQHAVTRFDAEKALLARAGLDVEMAEAGCCGMAGAWGFVREHHDGSVACGERVLLPKVRGAADDALIVADGFSCQEQIRQGTARTARHVADVLHEAAFGAGALERHVRALRRPVLARRLGWTMAALAAIAAVRATVHAWRSRGT
jgi:Fe-S oxidoreductase